METELLVPVKPDSTKFNRIYEEWKQNRLKRRLELMFGSIESMRNGNLRDRQNIGLIPKQFNRIYEEWKLVEISSDERETR